MANTAVIALSLEQLQRALLQASIITESTTVLNVEYAFNPPALNIMATAPWFADVAPSDESPTLDAAQAPDYPGSWRPSFAPTA